MSTCFLRIAMAVFFNFKTITLVLLIATSWIVLIEGKRLICNSNQTRLGVRVLYRKAMGDVGVLVCLKNSGKYQWRFIDGSSTLGEKLNPAKDCSDIVDHAPGAKDGFYWIKTGQKKHIKVWCDVNTDGGGFMLIGMKDSPVSWNVSSNSRPVDPNGPPHWSCLFGKFKVQDFAVQVSTNKSFSGTRAHWSYRLNPRRALGNLFGVGDDVRCTDVHSGIGNITYVKDILTETVVTRNFNCSKFGPHVNPSLGWGRMNYCFSNSCPTGYAFYPGIPIQLDSFGSFSYSTTSSLSGVTHDATSFIGCDNHECCACYGPKGGRNNYCGPACTSNNGGTVTKEAYVWFWIRGSVPKRVWKRCMEFKMKSSNGKIETYFIDRTTGTAQKGLCSNQFQALLNEGTLTVSDKDNLEKLPQVPGLLSYSKDNRQLYVNEGHQWEALSKEKEVESLKAEIKSIEEKLYSVAPSCTEIIKKYPHLGSGFYKIHPKGNQDIPLEVFCDMTSKNRVGVTIIGHNSEQRTKVQGYEAPGSYRRKTVYKASLDDIAALTKISKQCEQFIKYECVGSGIMWGKRYGWWVSRQGSQMTYWGGAAVNSGKCACGMTNSCAAGRKCNCDAGGNGKPHVDEDSGFLTDKSTLPVTELRFGDTGNPGEHGYHTLGKLLCWG